MDPKHFFKTEPYKMYIDGKFVASESGKTFDAVDPATGEVFAKGYKGGEAEVNMAIAAARRAYDEGPWGKMSAKERSKLLIKAGQIFERRAEEFAAVETADCGKLFMGVKFYDALLAADAFEFNAGKAQHIYGDVVPVESGTLNYVLWQPHGVVAEILPWNGPLMMGCQKISTILAAGNTVIVKPSSMASMSMLLLAEVFDEAGFPAGVVNVITGSGSLVGDMLVKSPDVDMVAMTGGTETGKHIIEASAETAKDIALEMGGKSPNIVFDDVNIDETVKWARFEFTLNSGEVCVSGTRLFVQRTIYEEFLKRLAEECAKFVPGRGFDFEKGVDYGPLISREHAKSVWDYIEKGKKEGARLICGGVPYTDPYLAEPGTFVPPTVFADVKPGMSIYEEEIFGPVLCVTPFDTEEEAIKLANGTKFGLAGGVQTKDVKRALRVAQSIHGGQIYVNSYFSNGMIESPGTGWKESGIGVAGIYKYMKSKTIFVSLTDGYVPY